LSGLQWPILATYTYISATQSLLYNIHDYSGCDGTASEGNIIGDIVTFSIFALLFSCLAPILSSPQSNAHGGTQLLKAGFALLSATTITHQMARLGFELLPSSNVDDRVLTSIASGIEFVMNKFDSFLGVADSMSYAIVESLANLHVTLFGIGEYNDEWI
jgi:hypothetical protein